MSEELLVTHCSPTLAGLKTGSLFICEYSTERELIGDLSRLNSVFVPKGLRIVTLRLHDGKALLYLYRPQKLSQDRRQNFRNNSGAGGCTVNIYLGWRDQNRHAKLC